MDGAPGTGCAHRRGNAANLRGDRICGTGFCGVCGAHIFHRPKDGPELAVSAGLFDADGLHVAREIFIDHKPPWYRFVADSVKRSEASMIREWLPRIIWRKIAKFGRG